MTLFFTQFKDKKGVAGTSVSLFVTCFLPIVNHNSLAYLPLITTLRQDLSDQFGLCQKILIQNKVTLIQIIWQPKYFSARFDVKDPNVCSELMQQSANGDPVTHKLDTAQIREMIGQVELSAHFSSVNVNDGHLVTELWPLGLLQRPSDANGRSVDGADCRTSFPGLALRQRPDNFAVKHANDFAAAKPARFGSDSGS